MTRTLDIIFSAFGLLLGSPILFVLWVMGFCDTGSPLFRQERVGKNRRLFVLVKFRTMRLDAPFGGKSFVECFCDNLVRLISSTD